MMHPTTNWPFRRTLDNTIDAICRIPEDILREQWQATILPSDRAGRLKNPTAHSFSAEERAQCSVRQQKRRLKKQAQYVLACSPKVDGDDEILRLFGEGARVDQISDRLQMPYEKVRNRIVACHPDGKPLR
jgi:hypothetical protein